MIPEERQAASIMAPLRKSLQISSVSSGVSLLGRPPLFFCFIWSRICKEKVRGGMRRTPSPRCPLFAPVAARAAKRKREAVGRPRSIEISAGRRV